MIKAKVSFFWTSNSEGLGCHGNKFTIFVFRFSKFSNICHVYKTLVCWNRLSTSKIIQIWVHYAENYEFRFSRLRRYLKSLFSNVMCSSVSLLQWLHVCTGNAFFVLKLVARATNHTTIVLITNSIKICIIYHLCEEWFHVDYWGGN